MVGVNFPKILGMITFVASFIVFLQIELERNSHELTFYKAGLISNTTKRWLMAYSIAEVLGRSMIFAVLSILLFSGTNALRITLLAVLFIICVIVGYYCLSTLKRVTTIDVARLGYARLSVLLGILFSIISAGITGIEVSEITWKTLKSLMQSPDIDGVAELLFGVVQKVNEYLAWLLRALLGRILGSIVSLMISINVLFGFVVLVYSLLLMRLIELREEKNHLGTSNSDMSLASSKK